MAIVRGVICGSHGQTYDVRLDGGPVLRNIKASNEASLANLQIGTRALVLQPDKLLLSSFEPTGQPSGYSLSQLKKDMRTVLRQGITLSPTLEPEDCGGRLRWSADAFEGFSDTLTRTFALYTAGGFFFRLGDSVLQATLVFDSEHGLAAIDQSARTFFSVNPSLTDRYFWLGDPKGYYVKFTDAEGLLIHGGALIEGTVTANNLVLGVDGYMRAGATGFLVGDGVWIGYDAGLYKAFVGSAAGEHMAYDGNLFTLTGEILAKRGTLGDMTVEGLLTVGTGDELLWINGYHGYMGSSNFVSGQKGFRILKDGAAEFSDVKVRGAIHSAVFVADENHAISGTLLVTKSSGKLRADVTLEEKIAPSTLAIDVDDPPSEHAALFEIFDHLYVNAGGIQAWLQVLNVVDQNEFFTYYCSCAPVNFDPETETLDLKAGVAIVNYGEAGDGAVKITADDTNAPHVSVQVFNGPASFTEYCRMGNLNGWGAFDTDRYGWLAGNYAADQYAYYNPTDGMVVKGDIHISSGQIDGLLDFGESGEIRLGTLANGIRLFKDDTYCISISKDSIPQMRLDEDLLLLCGDFGLTLSGNASPSTSGTTERMKFICVDRCAVQGGQFLWVDANELTKSRFGLVHWDDTSQGDERGPTNYICSHIWDDTGHQGIGLATNAGDWGHEVVNFAVGTMLSKLHGTFGNRAGIGASVGTKCIFEGYRDTVRDEVALAFGGPVVESTVLGCRVVRHNNFRVAKNLPEPAVLGWTTDNPGYPGCFDNYGMWSDTEPGRVYIRCAGVYLVSAHVPFGVPSGDNGSARVVALYKNDTVEIARTSHNPVYGSTTYVEFTHIVQLIQGDRLSIRVWHDAGAALDIVSVKGAGQYDVYAPSFTVVRVV